jgi:hypothetical protein
MQFKYPDLVKLACSLEEHGPANERDIHFVLNSGTLNYQQFANTQWLLDNWVKEKYLTLTIDKYRNHFYALTPIKGRWIAHAYGNQ